MTVRAFFVAIWLGSISFIPASYAGEPDGTSPDLHIDRQTRDASGDPARPVNLKIDILKPFGAGPFPLVVYNHGARVADNTPGPSLGISLDFNMGVYFFLSRGYAVAVPRLRGYQGSGGTLPNTGCALDVLGRANAKDILAALSAVTKDPQIDPARIIVIGESLGGWNSLAVAALRDPRVKAAVNFYGGVRSSACKAGDRALIEGARAFGKDVRIPSLWLYGDNDRFFRRPLWEAMHRAYAAGGSEADLFGYGTFEADSHTLLGHPYGVGVFAPKLDAFLERLNFPTRVTHPEFVPMTPPPASGYAAIDDVDAVPFMTDARRQAYREFLEKPAPKVFLLSEKIALWSASGFDPLAQGLADCRKQDVACRPYAFNDAVVWTYPNPQPPETHFAAIDDVAAIPYLDEAGRNGYRAFLKLRNPRAFVITPTSRWAAASGALDPTGAALALCRREHEDCRPYAVDRHVVWTEKHVAAPR